MTQPEHDEGRPGWRSQAAHNVVRRDTPMLPRPKAVTIELGRCWCAVRGTDAYHLLEAVRCRPVWSHISRAWMGQRHHGVDVAALAQLRGYSVDILRSVEPAPVVTPPPLAPEAVDADVQPCLFEVGQ